MVEHLDIDKQTGIRQQWEALLSSAGLQADPPYSSVHGIFENGRLVATGARDGNRLKCIAIDPGHRGGSLFSQLMTGIIAHAFDLGIGKLYLYAKPEAVAAFASAGFLSLAVAPGGVTFMERGRPSFADYLARLEETRDRYDGEHGRAGGPVESIVIEGDVLTSAERALIEKAAGHAKRVHLFIMGDEKALERIRRETDDLTGLIHHPAEGYFIPPALFPAYFLPDRSDRIRTQASLDALLFRNRIAPKLEITDRTVLDDPTDPLKSLYNETLRAFFLGEPRLNRVLPGQR
ncbi:MAG TPA: hypothetical protein PK646_00420 [Bacillota bacterium]|jgi:[citrate (pro-3S)-lyase] ligase|nr:hypothetical protein [Fastidiosipila sp.]HPX93574.1 hypothetical protein [Bacillota bacterium]HQB80549.1 hypothetical protein [Bacillota bacterium]